MIMAASRASNPALLVDLMASLQRAMEIKQRKYLEPVKGNPFAYLQADKMNKIAIDVNLKSGKDREESKFIINNMIDEEQKEFDVFVDSSPEIMLPTIQDFNCGMQSKPVDETETQVEISTPEKVLKEPDHSPSWTEVVRRGKTRSKSIKID
jgi:hypothetical protein